jgi:soluble lytic murein transglycosylase-like protein
VRKILLAALAVFALPGACRAGADVYVFIDERGTVHLSDVAQDARYRVLSSQPGSAAPGMHARPPAATGTGAPRRQYDAEVTRAAARFGVDPALVHAVIYVESAYDPNAVSRRGAAGLMQLMEPTARRYGVVDIFDPAQNIGAGTRHLKELLGQFGDDLRLALAAYNAGAAAVVKYGNTVPPFPETRAYVPKVVRRYSQLHE